MKWTIRLELTPDGNPANHARHWHDHSANCLTLEEGQQLLRRIQVQIIGSQAHAYALAQNLAQY
jgi:hypothetical protein